MRTGGSMPVGGCADHLMSGQQEAVTGAWGNGDGSHCNVPLLAGTGPMVVPIG